jgi:3-oxoacyl-[acyl-carrier protein] reductase
VKIDFKNKTVVITGGTRGIGADLCEAFLADGATVYATGTDRKKLKQLNKSAKSKLLQIKYLHLDFSLSESIDECIEDLKKLECIDVLINNAGVNKINYIENVEEEDWDWITNVNLRGPFLTTKALAPKMKAQKSGKIINISSIFGVVSKVMRSTYSMTKWGLIGFTKAVALELAPYNILVNTVSPGFVDTELTRKILGNEEIKLLREQIPQKRLANCNEITKTVMFLASEHNTYITGQNIIIDGGFTSA